MICSCNPFTAPECLSQIHHLMFNRTPLMFFLKLYEFTVSNLKITDSKSFGVTVLSNSQCTFLMRRGVLQVQKYSTDLKQHCVKEKDGETLTHLVFQCLYMKNAITVCVWPACIGSIHYRNLQLTRVHKKEA